MLVRPFMRSDLDQIEKIHEQYHSQGFGMPDVADAYAHVVCELDGKILAYGQVRDITESIMLLDHSLEKRVKIECLRQLMREAIFSASKREHDQIHAFVQDPSFELVLKRQFGYKDCKGKALVMNF